MTLSLRFAAMAEMQLDVPVDDSTHKEESSSAVTSGQVTSGEDVPLVLWDLAACSAVLPGNQTPGPCTARDPAHVAVSDNRETQATNSLIHQSEDQMHKHDISQHRHSTTATVGKVLNKTEEAIDKNAKTDFGEATEVTNDESLQQESELNDSEESNSRIPRLKNAMPDHVTDLTVTIMVPGDGSSEVNCRILRDGAEVMSTGSEDHVFTCSTCFLLFPDPEALSEHARIHQTGSTVNSALTPSRRTPERSNRTQNDPTLEWTNRNAGLKPGIFLCASCRGFFPTEAQIEEHFQCSSQCLNSRRVS